MAFLLTISQTGISMAMHYCGDDIADIALTKDHLKNCGCDEETEDDCCKVISVCAHNEITATQAIFSETAKVIYTTLLPAFTTNATILVEPKLTSTQLIQKWRCCFSHELSLVKNTILRI